MHTPIEFMLILLFLDTGTVLEDNGNDFATVETMNRMRGQAGTSITTSTVGMQDSGQGKDGQYSGGAAPMARRGPGAGQNLQVTNVDNAQTAIANFINEMDAQPLPVPGMHLTLTYFWF